MLTTQGTAPLVKAALRGRNLICFSNDWDGDPLSKTHLMRLLARDNRILWVNSVGYRAPKVSRADLYRALKKLQRFFIPVREVEPNIFVLNPFAVPLYGPLARSLNRKILSAQVRYAIHRLKCLRPITWVFLPAAAVVAGSLGESALIYYCVDEFSAFTGVPTQAMADLEGDLLARADLVIVSSERLYQSKVSANHQTRLVRHGVDFEHFRQALDPTTEVPSEIAHLPRPILGYFGLIAQDWVDIELLMHLAKKYHQGSLVMLGKVTMDISALQALTNVHFLGRRPYAELPAFCRGFDVGLIPFPVSELTLNANPLKAREYLAAGLPVVSTLIPEVQILPHCRTAFGPEAFAAAVGAALAEPGPNPDRSESMRSESWRARLDEVCLHLSEAVPGLLTGDNADQGL